MLRGCWGNDEGRVRGVYRRVHESDFSRVLISYRISKNRGSGF
jgi:hypothetical protein